MYKQICALLLLGTIIISCIIPAHAADNTFSFTDVAEDAWYYDDVSAMSASGYVHGITDSQFDPDAAMTREMFLTILGRCMDVDPDETAAVDFVDVAQGQWYTPYVAWAVKYEITNGVDSDHFGLGQAISREQMATFLVRCADAWDGFTLKKSETPADFQDMSQISDWALAAVERMREAGIMVGDDKGNFNPQKSVTRAEGTAVLRRFLDARVPCEPKLLHSELISNSDRLCVKTTTNPATPVIEVWVEGEDVAEWIEYISNAPVIETKSAPDTVGWNYYISFYDTNQYMGGYQFDKNWIDIDGIRYYTSGDYFSLLIQQFFS